MPKLLVGPVIDNSNLEKQKPIMVLSVHGCLRRGTRSYLEAVEQDEGKRAGMHACIRAYMHTYVHTYIHTYVHTYKDARIQSADTNKPASKKASKRASKQPTNQQKTQTSKQTNKQTEMCKYVQPATKLAKPSCQPAKPRGNSPNTDYRD